MQRSLLVYIYWEDLAKRDGTYAILLPNCVQFCNALEPLRSSNCPKSNAIRLNFFCKALVNI